MTYELTFDECEHYGDLSTYADGLREAGFTGVNDLVPQPFNLDEDDERGRIRVDYDGDTDDLRLALRAAGLYGWISGIREVK